MNKLATTNTEDTKPRPSSPNEDADTVMLTETLIMAGASVVGGWSDNQIQCLAGPKPFGRWKRRLRGTYVSRAAYERFMALKDAHLNLNSPDYQSLVTPTVH
jgi:hypothetical protein